MMKNGSNVAGIGCFAKSATLRRVFRKSLENFILSKYEDFYPTGERMIHEENLTQFFRSVIALGTEKPGHIDRAMESVPVSAKISGFFLGLNKQALHLAVFFGDDGFQQRKFIARLEKFTRLRNKRLH
jgi:hypothetical protein